MPTRFWPFMIASLLLGGCNHTPGDYRERGLRELDVVQRPGETHLEFFLCDAGQADCLPSVKTPYSAATAAAVTAPLATNSPAVSPRYSDAVMAQLKAFELGQPVAIHFEFESARLNKAATELLPALATLLRENGIVTLAVRGETDGFGSHLYNNALAEKRLRAVIRFLTDQGFPATGLVVSKKPRCCRKDRPNGQSVAAAGGERVVLLRGKDARPD